MMFDLSSKVEALENLNYGSTSRDNSFIFSPQLGRGAPFAVKRMFLLLHDSSGFKMDSLPEPKNQFVGWGTVTRSCDFEFNKPLYTYQE